MHPHIAAFVCILRGPLRGPVAQFTTTVAAQAPEDRMTGQSKCSAAATFLCPEAWCLEQIGRLTDADRANLLEVVAIVFGNEGKPFKLATMCSGTEVPTLWFHAFLRAALSLLRSVDISHEYANPTRTLVHEFARECEKTKQDWIMQNFDVPLLFENIEHLARGRAWCVRHRAIKDVPATDGVVASTSCKDLSPQKSDGKGEVLSSGEGCSSLTLRSLLAYCKKLRPMWACGENVLNLLGGSTGTCVDANSNFGYFKSEWRAIGYVIFHLVTNPVRFSVPNRRHRVYWWVFRCNCVVIWFCHSDHELVMRHISAVCVHLEELSNERDTLLDVDDFRLSSDTEPVPDRYLAGNEWNLPDTDTLERAKLPEVHRSYCADQSIEWPARTSAFSIHPELLAVVYPAIAVLPIREKDLSQVVDAKYCARDPGSGITADGKRIFIDGSQALNRHAVAFDMTPCILPGSKMIDRSNCRIMSGVHLLRLMGVLPTADHSIQYDVVKPRVQSDLAGNACNGWSFGLALIVIFSTSKVNPTHRIKRKRSRTFSFSLEPDTSQEVAACPLSKRHSPASGLGALLTLLY